MDTQQRLSMPLGETLFSMRAIRRFRPDPIPDADLRAILEAAIQAPSGGNTQPWHFIVLTEAAQRAAFAPLYREAWWAKRRDVGIRGPEDIAATDKVAQAAMRLANEEIGKAPAIIFVCATGQGAGPLTSVIPATQNLLLAARALGVGGTITTLHADVDIRVRAMLGVPEAAQIVYCVPLGYPRGRFGPLNRKPLASVVSDGRWGTPAAWLAD